jgi:hypothetical protein
MRSNPARASEFRRRPRRKHCAAQAEYGRLAAQAYSPSDAMSQARLCLDGMRKVQCVRDEFGEAICLLKRGLAADVSVREGGGPFGFAPPMRRGRLAGRGAALAEPAGFKTRGGLRALSPGVLDKAAAAAYGVATARPAGPAAAPVGAPGCGRGSTAMSGDGCHAVEASAGWVRRRRQLTYACSLHSARILTDGSGETASTLKIVSDVTRVSICRWTDKTMRPPVRRPHRES